MRVCGHTCVRRPATPPSSASQTPTSALSLVLTNTEGFCLHPQAGKGWWAAVGWLDFPGAELCSPVISESLAPALGHSPSICGE